MVFMFMDLNTSFLNRDLYEKVHMEQPKRFVLPRNEHKICKVVQSLYGLKSHSNNGIKNLIMQFFQMVLFTTLLANVFIQNYVMSI